VENSSGAKSAPVTFTIASTMADGNGGTLGIETESLPAASAGNSYREALLAKGGTPPYTWSLLDGALPSGIALSATTGQLLGSATSSGTHVFTAQVTDSGGSTNKKRLSLAVQENVPAVVTSSVPSASVNSGYAAKLNASGGTAPYTWTVSGGTLPTGLSLDTDGKITGSAKNSGTYSFTAQVMDALGQSSSRIMSLRVAAVSTQVQDSMFREDFEKDHLGFIATSGSGMSVVDTGSVPGGCLAGDKCGQIQTRAGGCCGQQWWGAFSASVQQPIYVQFYVKFESGFRWGTDSNCEGGCGGGSNNMKLVYFQSNGRSNSKLYFEASGSGDQTPGGNNSAAIWQAMTDEGQHWVNGGTLTGDGQWHKVKIKLDKPNRQVTYWIDGVQKGPWSDPVCEGGCTVWNAIGIGLYNNNRWPQSQKVWYDNIVVSTKDIA
jgi:hypothetical protein